MPEDFDLGLVGAATITAARDPPHLLFTEHRYLHASWRRSNYTASRRLM
jgi:hypothetical protein